MCPVRSRRPLKIRWRDKGSILPTSLTYIVLSTRGCSPRRPDAVMCTTETPYLSSEFSRADESAPDTSRSDVLCQLAYPYLRVNRFQGKKLLKRKDNSSRASYRKGSRLIFLHRDFLDITANANEGEDASGSPGKSYLFFLTASFLGIGLPGDKDTLAGKAHHFLMCPVRSRRPLKIRWRDKGSRSYT